VERLLERGRGHGGNWPDLGRQSYARPEGGTGGVWPGFGRESPPTFVFQFSGSTSILYVLSTESVETYSPWIKNRTSE